MQGKKGHRHVDALFGAGVSDALPADIQFDFSKRTGRIKNFSIGGRLAVTLRTDGGLALTIAAHRTCLRIASSSWRTVLSLCQRLCHL